MAGVKNRRNKGITDSGGGMSPENSCCNNREQAEKLGVIEILQFETLHITVVLDILLWSLDWIVWVRNE